MRRTTLKSGLVALMISACMPTFTACSSDDDSNGGDPAKPTTASMTYKYVVKGDLFSVADITITYTDAEGKSVAETMTDTSWTKTVVKSLPCSFGFTVAGSMKQGVELTKDLYDVGHGAGWDLTVGSGNNNFSHHEPYVTTSYIKADRVAEYVTRSISGKTNATFTVDSDGNKSYSGGDAN